MALPTLDEEGKLILEPETIIKEYLIKWKSCPEEDASWEPNKFLQQHPSLIFFEDEAS